MKTIPDLLYVLALQHARGVGDIMAKKLIARCGSARAVFEERPDRLLGINGVGRRVLENIRKKENLEAAEKELRFLEDHDIGCSYFEQDHYPERLRYCADGPILLFRSGSADLNSRKVISIVGTRNITSYGKRFCEKLVSDLASFDPLVVSGFAYGVDITAHKAALACGLQTVGCLAHGLNQIYPRAHKPYVSGVEARGGFVTDFWSSSMPERENFLKRNRIIAGLSEATVVVESAAKGGALVTAGIAHSYHREVFAVPGRTEDRYSEGCNNLIRSHKAHILTSAEDLVYLLGWHRELLLARQEASLKNSGQASLFPQLDATEQKVYAFLSEHGREMLDIIALRCEIPVYRLSPVLLAMEMKGVVRPLPGKLFEAVFSA
ncbi:DNA-processing protein DprA [Sinomicrobium soli]|uniref:DNA-processing protein DprA n=1 Tax=Sinomicrobium sp. N-1-3-6 TaxID=2219864 RepID=UPI000DCE31B9|nr:DNA-processing protein DprA [Sinomicrobium sp. N-1-3-6]RAV29459.1 DNA-protecting protein DprA [Sinomicrobium sp. N-1-3-6]